MTIGLLIAGTHSSLAFMPQEQGDNDDQNQEGYQDQENSQDNEYYDGRFYPTFYRSLRPYGEWIDCSYGHVWRPTVVRHEWRPYSNGRWVWTDYGWYWMSYDPFGWAVFHYGRWEYDSYYGWIWVPDNVWGPAWVEWRYNDSYIGWAPLTLSASFSVNYGVTLTHGWVAPVHYWNFIPCNQFTSTHIIDYVQPVSQTQRFFGSTRGVTNIRMENNRVVNHGVDVAFVEKKANTHIRRLDIVENKDVTGERISNDAHGGSLQIYRPQLGRTPSPSNGRRTVDEQRSAPSGSQGSSQPRGLRSGPPSSVRQYRESEQRFEIPRPGDRYSQQRKDILERQKRSWFGSTPPKFQQHPAPSAPQPQVRQNERSGNPRPSQPQQEKKPAPPVHNGRRP